MCFSTDEMTERVREYSMKAKEKIERNENDDDDDRQISAEFMAWQHQQHVEIE